MAENNEQDQRVNAQIYGEAILTVGFNKSKHGGRITAESEIEKIVTDVVNTEKHKVLKNVSFPMTPSPDSIIVRISTYDSSWDQSALYSKLTQRGYIIR